MRKVRYNSPLVSFTAEGIKKHDINMWHQVLSVDLNSVFYMSLNVIEKMILNRTQGVIINISSICAAGNAGQCAYSAAKAGVNAFTIALSKELGALGIRVAAIAPGYMMTGTMRQSMVESMLKEHIRKTPLKRFGTSEEIADAALFIIRNDFFNGKILKIDGGMVLGS